MKFVPKDTTGKKPAFVQVMAWQGPGNKPLHEPLLTQVNTLVMTWSQQKLLT